MIDERTEMVLREIACNADAQHRVSAFQVRRKLEPNFQTIIEALVEQKVIVFVKDTSSKYYQFTELGWKKYGCH